MLIEIEHGDEVCVLRLTGHFRTGEDPGYVRHKADEIRSHDCTKMLADLRELKSIGSMGMGFVVGVYISVTKRSGGGRFMLVGANPRVLEVLELTRLNTIIPLAADIRPAWPRCGLKVSIAFETSLALGTRPVRESQALQKDA